MLDYISVCIDLVFMVDASNNVGRDTFNKVCCVYIHVYIYLGYTVGD